MPYLAPSETCKTYAFGRSAAVDSFRAAQKFDPDCAMCYWGEAWARGPYQNGKMEEEAAEKAYSAIQKARRLMQPATPVERALIEGMSVRYEPQHSEEDRGRLDLAYAEAMREIVRQFPRDLDAGTLFAEALIVLHPWDLYLEGGIPRPETVELVAALESILARNIKASAWPVGNHVRHALGATASPCLSFRLCPAILLSHEDDDRMDSLLSLSFRLAGGRR